MISFDDEKLHHLLQIIAPDTVAQDVDAQPLGFSNSTFRLTTIHATGDKKQYIVKLYSPTHQHVMDRDVYTRARLEYETIDFLKTSDIPAPQRMYFDTGDPILGSPVLVTQPIDGEQIMAHPANPEWAEKASKVAHTLANLHMLNCPDKLLKLLPDATQQTTLACDGDTIPDYMQAYPDGELIWTLIREYRPKMKQTQAVLAHGDFWSGNMLWKKNQLTGLLDWENVAYGERGFDVAYCLLEMILEGMNEAADTFLHTYEAITVQPVVNLDFCKLAVAIFSMRQRAPYLKLSPYQERYRKFVANAANRLQMNT